VSSQPFAGLSLARILRPWGRRGDVAAEIFTDFPERLAALRQAWLADARDARAVEITSCRLHKGQAIFHFAGVDSISDAERLRGMELQVPLSERASLRAGRYYISDLIGCSVFEENSSAALGTVREVQSIGPAGERVESWILAIETPRGELLIPLAAEICTSVNLTAHRIEVKLPEGLLELNRDTRSRRESA
jgi:16S rRNA processing protein RimM